ncbi:hypothetical protein ES703_80461 [subsurface metagenome]
MTLELGIRVGSELVAIGASVPIGVSGAILIGGTNDMTTNQKMGARWEVRDPDGVVVDSYEDWEMFWTGPGLEQGFVGNRFDLNKLGTYTVKADLLMNPDDPVTVDSYEGDLCAVTTEVPPTYEEIQHTVYPYAYIYDGDVEVSTATFKTDPFTPSAWMGEKFASKLEEEVRKAGGRVLEVWVYVDITPLLWTNFRVEVIGTPLGATAGVATAVGIALWLAIILICLAIIALIVVATLAFTTVTDRLQHKPGLEDVKPGWGKETLILTIHDSEEHWERPLTPTETLEGMSEPELREYLDAMAEEEVPPEVGWLPLAIFGGVAVLGIGVAVALAAPKR